MHKILRDALLALPGVIAVIERWGARAMDLIGLPSAAAQFQEWINAYFPDIGAGTYYLIGFSVIGLGLVHVWPATKKPSDVDKPALANKLKSKLLELDHLMTSSSNPLLPFELDREGIRWEQATIKIMREGGIAESEIHMFETISYIPRRGALFPRRAGPDKEALEALKAKREKLRRIIGRLLGGNEK